MTKIIEKTIAVYIRVSTTGQNEEGQTAEIIKWLKGHGHDPAADDRCPQNEQQRQVQKATKPTMAAIA